MILDWKTSQVKQWSMRVRTSLLVICMVDAWKLYARAKGDEYNMSPNQFYCELTHQLIHNKYDRISLRQRESDSDSQEGDMDFAIGIGTHFDTKYSQAQKSISTEDVCSLSSHMRYLQRYKTSKVILSTCKFYFDKEVYLCHHQTGRDCFKTHVDERHDLT